MSDLMLDVNQAAEIKMAARRANATNADLKALSEGDMFARILPVLRGRAEVVINSILTLIRTLTLPAQPKFPTSVYLWEQTGVKWMGNNFKRLCLGVPTEAPAMELAIHKLEQDSVDTPILEELGEKARIPLVQIAAFLNSNKESKRWFIFYPEELPEWVVSARWDVDLGGWYVNAHSVTNPVRWNAGRQVVSRN